MAHQRQPWDAAAGIPPQGAPPSPVGCGGDASAGKLQAHESQVHGKAAKAASGSIKQVRRQPRSLRGASAKHQKKVSTRRGSSRAIGVSEARSGAAWTRPAASTSSGASASSARRILFKRPMLKLTLKNARGCCGKPKPYVVENAAIIVRKSLGARAGQRGGTHKVGPNPHIQPKHGSLEIL